MPETIQEKKDFLIGNRIALWDVLASCDITGAKDSSIANPVPNDLSHLISSSRINFIYANGSKAGQLYIPHYGLKGQIPFKKLPSTSPANAQYSMSRLLEEWRCITQHVKGFPD